MSRKTHQLTKKKGKRMFLLGFWSLFPSQTTTPHAHSFTRCSHVFFLWARGACCFLGKDMLLCSALLVCPCSTVCVCVCIHHKAHKLSAVLADTHSFPFSSLAYTYTPTPTGTLLTHRQGGKKNRSRSGSHPPCPPPLQRGI